MPLSVHVANLFVKQGGGLNQMCLQRLVYLADGWNLAINNKCLVWDRPMAYEYGPVYPSLQGAALSYGTDPISEALNALLSDEFTQNELGIIDRVFCV